MKYLLSVVTIISIVFVACVANENEMKIRGNWSGVQWLINGAPSDLKANGTFFTFDDKGRYTYEYPGYKEKGNYKVENDMLFTTPDNEPEMMVKIAHLTKDTLIFNMSRSGQEETLTLIRK